MLDATPLGQGLRVTAAARWRAVFALARLAVCCGLPVCPLGQILALDSKICGFLLVAGSEREAITRRWGCALILRLVTVLVLQAVQGLADRFLQFLGEGGKRAGLLLTPFALGLVVLAACLTASCVTVIKHAAPAPVIRRVRQERQLLIEELASALGEFRQHRLQVG